MAMEQREVEGVAGVLPFSLEVGYQWPEDAKLLTRGSYLLYSGSMADTPHLRSSKSICLSML